MYRTNQNPSGQADLRCTSWPQEACATPSGAAPWKLSQHAAQYSSESLSRQRRLHVSPQSEHAAPIVAGAALVAPALPGDASGSGSGSGSEACSASGTAGACSGAAPWKLSQHAAQYSSESTSSHKLPHISPQSAHRVVRVSLVPTLRLHKYAAIPVEGPPSVRSGRTCCWLSDSRQSVSLHRELRRQNSRVSVSVAVVRSSASSKCVMRGSGARQ